MGIADVFANARHNRRRSARDRAHGYHHPLYYQTTTPPDKRD